MDGQNKSDSGADVQRIIRDAIEEFIRAERTTAEPAYKAELVEERRKREHLEGKVNELLQENRRSRQLAEEVERGSAIRSELQRLGVAKVDLAFRAVKDDIVRAEDGRLVASQGGMSAREYLTQFVAENPEFLPARIPGGSGMTPASRNTAGGGTFDLSQIRPGMDPEEMERARREISRVAAETLRGQ